MTTTAYIVNRKLKMVTLGLTIFYSLFTPSAVFGAFEDSGTGARAAALGGAYVALGDDTFSLMYNPASLARIRSPEAVTEYSRFYSGLTDGSNLSQYFLGYSQPLKMGGVVAFGWRQYGLDSLYAERTLAFGYGRWFGTRLAAGVAIKQLHESFAAPSIVVDDAGNIQSGTPSLFAQNGTATSAYSGDIGILYRLSPRYMLGFSVQDVNAPNMALSSSDDDTVPRTFRLGLAYQRPNGLALTSALTERDNVPGSQDYKGAAAIEKWWNEKAASWALRGALVVGSQDLRQFSMGFGCRLSDLLLDYAFVFNLSGVGLGDTAGTHRFSLSYRLGSLGKRVAHALKPGTRTSGAAPAVDESAAVLSVSTNSVQGLMPFTLDVSSPTRSAP